MRKSGGGLAGHVIDMLQLYAQVPDETIYQRDGVSPHFADIVHTFVDELFAARWIRKGSPYITWSARSRDLMSTAVGQVVTFTRVTQRALVRSTVGTCFLGEVFWGFFLICKTNVGKL